MLLPLCTSACTLPTLVRRGGRMLFISILAILLHASTVHAQNAPPEKPKVTRILFLLDASGQAAAGQNGRLA
jgi:Ca-activated chloride channel family protein